jgi:RNA polymerase sigma-70 factor, ECF subfamily
MLERYAWAIVRDWSLAADAVQNGFIALSRFGGDVLPEARKNWLFRVVHRESLRIREKQSRFQAMPADADLVLEPSTSYELNPVAIVLHEEEVENLNRKVKKLSAEQQQVVRMRIYEDRTFAEIAQQLEIPIGTALSRMRLALERLRAGSDESND